MNVFVSAACMLHCCLGHLEADVHYEHDTGAESVFA